MIIFALVKIVMKRFLNTLFSLILAVVFLVSTSGVMVYLHHCYHKNTTYTSLFFNFNNGEQHPCKPVSQSCCSQHDHHDKDIPSQCDASCCQDIAFMLKYTPDTEPVQKHHVKIIPVINAGKAVASFSITDQVAVNSDAVPHLPPEKPPITGREKVILYHQLKDAPSC